MARTLPDSVTNADWDRYIAVTDKMVCAARAAGREYTDTADLSPDDRAFYRRVYSALVEHEHGEPDGV